jgi:hypothetical protein
MRMGGICFALTALLVVAACSTSGGSGGWPDGYTPPAATDTGGNAGPQADTSGTGMPTLPDIAGVLPGVPGTDLGPAPVKDTGAPTPVDATILGETGQPLPADILMVGDVPAAANCDPIKGTGCPQGSHCAYNEAGQIACTPSGSQEPGQICGGADRCKLGTCVQLAQISEEYMCYAYCNVPGDCADTHTCAGVQGAPFKLCVPKPEEVTCNLLNQDCAKEGQACFLLQDQASGENKTLCVDSMGVEPGQPCQYANACTAGYLCINNACTKICDTSAEASGCAEGENCQSFYAAQNVGVCVGPAPTQ